MGEFRIVRAGLACRMCPSTCSAAAWHAAALI